MRLLLIALALAAAWPELRADSGDIEGSHDYPGFPRYPGFVITDYDEDSPAVFSFPVSRPQPTDAAHIEAVALTGHRYVIRYAPRTNVAAPGLFQVQDYYEKQAAAAHFTIEKSGAVGDVTETFHQAEKGHDIWVYLEPGMGAHVVTVLEATGPAPNAVPASAAPAEDPLYGKLIKIGRVILPLTFRPGKAELEANAQLVIDRVARLLQKHPDLRVSIEGHTDNTGDPGVNLLLSETRAQVTRNLIVAGGVDPARLTSTGYGGDNPIANNETAEGRAMNRRIELVLVK